MAIHYKYIKGLNNDDSSNNFFSFVHFPRSQTTPPTFEVGTANAAGDSGATNFGEFIMSNPVSAQTITQPLTAAGFISSVTNLVAYHPEFGSEVSLLQYDIVNNRVSLPLAVYCANDITSASDITASDTIKAQNAKITVKCQAGYYNSTSDRRAKTDIKQLNFNALNLINNTNVYSFIYKELNTPSIGIIAQEVQDVDLNGFKLVDNEQATGCNFDYMTIHESKLVYVL